jgi:hypothetical protein
MSDEIVTTPVPSKVSPPEILLCPFCGGKGHEQDGHLFASPEAIRYTPPSLCRMCKGEKEVFVCPASQGSDTAAARRLMVKAAEDYKAKCDEIDQLKAALNRIAAQEPAVPGLAPHFYGHGAKIAADALFDLLPLPACSECKGAGCNFCEGTGVDDK